MNDLELDVDLWRRMTAGDVAAWGELFDRHAARVYRFCVRFIGNTDEAEDVVSDTFMEVWRARRSLTVVNDSALPILLAIARRAGQKRLRSTGRWTRAGQLTRDSSAKAVDDIAEHVVSADESERRRAWLRSEAAALPTPFRDVFELVIYAELSYADVALLLRVPVGTVKSRMARVRHRLEDQAHPSPRTERALTPDPA